MAEISASYEAPKPIEALTYLDLVRVIIKERAWVESGATARGFQSRINTWCTHVGATLNSLAYESLATDVTPALNRLLEARGSSIDESAGSGYNLRWAVTDIKRAYESLRTNSNLPVNFKDALALAMQTAGLTIRQLIERVDSTFPGTNTSNTTLRSYLLGKTAPYAKQKKSRGFVAKLEVALGLQKGVLSRRAFKDDSLVLEGNPDEIAYRTYQSRRTKLRYSLTEMPPQMDATWKEIVHWRSQPACRVNGELHTIPKSAYWSKPRSGLKYKNNLLRYMGWLCLPAPIKPLYELTEDERWQRGKGLKQEDITLAHWTNLDLLWEFTEFLRERQHNKAFTQDHLHFLIFINSLINHPYSYFKAHPKLAPIYGVAFTGADWVDFVEKTMHLPTLKMCSQIKKVIDFNVKQRSPDEPLRAVFADEDPLLLLLKMVSRMEDDLPPLAQQRSRAVYLRDIALFRMELDVPLRVGNLVQLKIGKEVKRDSSTGLWALFIAKDALKNHHSKHAFDISRNYSVKTSQAIDRYIAEGRCALAGAKETDWLFLAQSTGPARKAGTGPYQANENSLYWAVRSRTKQYFGGDGIGSNLFRHLLATAVLKDDAGQVETASAMLNNSPETIRSNYKHLTQGDGLRAADAWRDGQNEKYTARFGETEA